MNSLLQKDFCLYRAPFYTAAIAIIAPWLLAMVAMFYNVSVGANRELAGIFETAAMFGVLSAIICAAIFGGFAFSVERREKSADFLGMLPVARAQVMASKVLISLGPLIVLWIIQASSFFLVNAYESNGGEPANVVDLFTAIYAVSCAAMILAFGIAWLMGLFIKSPSICASIALATLLAFWFSIWLYRANTMDPGPVSSVIETFFAGAMTVGIFCFFAGAVVYTKRVRP